jgi:predicted enzyme related to lactoylglutathione lyase
VTAAAVVYVRDLRRMRDFYEACFGMSVLESGGDEYCVLASEDWSVSLVAVPATIAATWAITDPPERREETPVKLAFEVANIEELRAVITRTGGQADPAGSAWDFRGFRHLDCLDPEGNVVQLRQRLPAG